MEDWRFTSDGEPAYYADNEQTRAEPNVANQEIPGYRPGTVTGEIQESDAWHILVATKWWMWKIGAEVEDLSPDYDWEDYLWKIDARTFFLYDQPDREGFCPMTQRVVVGAFAVQDELGWMGFAATFSGEDLRTLSLEVDTEWSIAVTEVSSYRYGEDPKYVFKIHTHENP